jgi:hypothetical protein
MLLSLRDRGGRFSSSAPLEKGSGMASRRTLYLPALLVATAVLMACAAAVLTLSGKAEARTDSFDARPPQGVLMKDADVLQVQSFSGGNWSYYQQGGWASVIFDNFGEYDFPKADVVGAGTRLHVRLAKPERPSVRIVAHPRVKD